MASVYGDHWPDRGVRWACVGIPEDGQSVITLDGDFDAAELRQIADWLDTE